MARLSDRELKHLKHHNKYSNNTNTQTSELPFESLRELRRAMLASGQRASAPSDHCHVLRLTTLSGSGSPAAQASPMANNWRQTGYRCRRHSSHGRLGSSSPALCSNQQVHGAVHQLLYHQWRATTRSPMPLSQRTKLVAATSTPLEGPPQPQPQSLLPTRVAFSTADIRRALRLVAASTKRNGTVRPSTRSATLLKTTTGSPRKDRPADWETRSVFMAVARTARRRSELSPVCSVAASAKFKSSDSEGQQSEKNDLHQAAEGGDNGGVSSGGDQSSCDRGLTSTARVAAILVKSPSDVEIASGDQGLRLADGGPLKTRRDWSERDIREKTCKPSDAADPLTSHNELGLDRAAPVAPYANARQPQHSVSEHKAIPTQEQQAARNCREQSGEQAALETAAHTEAEAMTTGSFVSTDRLSQQQSINQNLEPDELLRSQQQQRPTHFNLAPHQQSARPIGLGCSGSRSSSSLSSEGQEQDCGQQDLHVASFDLATRDEAANMSQGGERYTIISSSSAVSLSDNSDQHYGRNRHGGAGDGANTSSSTNALNQRGAMAGKNLLGKLVGKKASRIRELLLQNLGRADRTTDELFDLCEMNFYKQQQHVQQLIKEFKSYTTALKGYHEATRSLSKCIQQSTSNYQLARHDLACDSLSQLDQLNEDLMEKLHEKVIKSLGDYLERFDEIKEKINKRHRKLIDYDSSRRLYELMYARVSKKRSLNAQQPQQQPQNYQSILRGLKFLSQQQQQQQQSAASGSLSRHQESVIASQLVDEARLLKLREQFNYCKLMYETINSELHDEMPIVYERKMKSLLNALQNYYDIKAHYHSEASKLIAKVGDVMVVVKPQSANDEANTILSMYDDSADGKLPSAGRELIGAGSGSSGVSLSGSASRSSGSSMASPDCDDNHRHRGAEQHAAGDDDGGFGENQANKSANDVDMPTNLVGTERAYAEESLESLSGEANDLPPASSLENDAPDGKPDEQNCSSKTSNEEQQTSLNPVVVDGDDHCKTHQTMIDAEESQVGVAKIENVPVVDEAIHESSDEPAVKSEESLNEATSGPDVSTGQKDYLYRVRTNYKYLAEDVDELCFEANEIIQVIEFDENQEPEDGWLLGIREVNNQRGLFPANFTQPI